MRILEECVRCFISSLFMGIFLAKAHCRYIPLIQRFKIIVFRATPHNLQAAFL